MKSSRLSLFLVFALLFAPTAPASNTTASTAGIAGIVLGPLIVQGVTGSQLDVTVEVYRETALFVGYAPDGCPLYKFNGKTFRLSGPVAMRSQIRALSDTAASPTAARLTGSVQKIGDLLGKQRPVLDSFTAMRNKFAAEFKEQAANKSAQALLKEMDEVIDKNAALEEVFTKFRRAVLEGLSDGDFSTAEVAKASDLLLAVQLAAAEVPRDFSASLGGFLRTQLRTALGSALDGAPEASGVAIKGLATDDDLLAFAAADATRGQIAAVEDALWDIVQRVQGLKEKSWHFVEGEKVHTGSEKKITEALNKVLGAVGYDVDFAALLKIKERGDFEARWSLTTNAIQRVAAVPVEIATLSFTGVSVGMNVGPIINEVIQGIFTESQLIDRVVTDQGGWKRMNHVYSRGGAGDHNAVVYMDNMLTPILKSAKFDPSQFIAANAQIYERATEVFSNVIGVPLAKDTAADGGTESLNLLNLKARKLRAIKSTDDDRDRMLALIKLILDEQETLKDKFVEPAKPEVPGKDAVGDQPAVPKQDAKPESWKDEAKTKTHLLELAKSIGAAATRLEQH